MGVDDLFALFSVWGVDDLFALRFKVSQPPCNQIHGVQSIQSNQIIEGRRPVSTKIHSIQSVHDLFALRFTVFSAFRAFRVRGG